MSQYVSSILIYLKKNLPRIVAFSFYFGLGLTLLLVAILILVIVLFLVVEPAWKVVLLKFIFILLLAELP